MLVLAAITRRRLAAVIRHLPCEPQHGRPWSCSLAQRILIISTMTPRLAALAAQSRLTDRRESWVVDGTLIPTRDHRRAARSKNYRWSCNAQVLIRRRDLRIVATTAGGPGNRNDPVHYRGSNIEALCQQHGRVLADGGYRGIPELVTPTFRGNRILRDRAWRGHRRRRARSSTPSLASRTGASCAIIAVVPAISRTPSRRSPSCTISTLPSCGTNFRRPHSLRAPSARSAREALARPESRLAKRSPQAPWAGAPSPPSPPSEPCSMSAMTPSSSSSEILELVRTPSITSSSEPPMFSRLPATQRGCR